VEGHPLFIDILDVFLDAAPLLGQLHDVADIVCGHNDFGIHKGFLDAVYIVGIGKVYGIVDHDLLAVFEVDQKSHAGSGGNDRNVVFPQHPFLHDLQVQHAQKSAAEAISQSGGIFLFIHQRGVVELELGDRIHQVFIVFAIDGKNAAEHHRLGLLKARQGFSAATFGQSDGVAHPGVCHLFDIGDDISRLTGHKFLHGSEFEPQMTDLLDLIFPAGGKEADAVTLAEFAVHEPHQHHHAAIHVKIGIKDQGLGRSVFLSNRRRQHFHHLVQQLVDPDSGLGAHLGDFFGKAAQNVRQIVLRAFNISFGEVDLVDRRQQFKVVFQRQIEVAHRLGFDALRSIHQQDGTFAGRQSAGNLIAEIHMPGRVDQIEHIVLALVVVDHADGVALDGDAFFAFEVHAVQHLGHIHLAHHVGGFQKTICQSGFAVVDVGHDAEIADKLLFHCMSLIVNKLCCAVSLQEDNTPQGQLLTERLFVNQKGESCAVRAGAVRAGAARAAL